MPGSVRRGMSNLPRRGAELKDITIRQSRRSRSIDAIDGERPADRWFGGDPARLLHPDGDAVGLGPEFVTAGPEPEVPTRLEPSHPPQFHHDVAGRRAGRVRRQPHPVFEREDVQGSIGEEALVAHPDVLPPRLADRFGEGGEQIGNRGGTRDHHVDVDGVLAGGGQGDSVRTGQPFVVDQVPHSRLSSSR